MDLTNPALPTSEDIFQLLGEAARQRAWNKRQGNANSDAGRNYEDCVSVVTLVTEATIWLRSIKPQSYPTFVYQPLGFVDDLTILRASGSEFIQIKNKKRQSWGTGAKSLAQDFLDQAALLREWGDHAELTLTVSSSELVASLKATRPAALAAVRIRHVPHVDVPRGAWRAPFLSNCFADLLTEDHSNLAVETACRAFVNVWREYKGRGTLKQLYDGASSLCDAALRQHEERFELSDAASNCLKAIQDAQIRPAGRGFWCEDRCGMSFFHEFASRSEFDRFQELLVAEQPANLRTLRAILRTV